MESRRDPPHTVVYIGADVELGRAAAADAGITDGADPVLSVDDINDVSSAHLSAARVVV